MAKKESGLQNRQTVKMLKYLPISGITSLLIKHTEKQQIFMVTTENQLKGDNKNRIYQWGIGIIRQV